MTSSTYPGVGLRHIEATSSNSTWNINCPATAIPQPLTLNYPVAGSNRTESITLKDLWKNLEDPTSAVNITRLLSNKEINTLPLVGNIRKQTVGCAALAEELKKGSNKKDQYHSWLLNNKPFIVENEILDQLQRCFNFEQGLILHGYEQSSYLQLIVEHLYRSFVYDVENQLTLNWIKIGELKGVDVNAVLKSKECNRMAQVIHKHLKSFNYRQRNVRVDAETIKNSFMGKDVKHKDSLAKMMQAYIEQQELDDENKSHKMICQSITVDTIKRMYVINHIRTEGREVDFLVVLPRLQVILQVEMKYVHDIDTKKTKDTKEHMTKASKQLSQMIEWITKTQSDLFTDWRYLGVVSFPTISRTSPLLESFTDLEKDFMLLQGEKIEDFFYKLTKKYFNVNIPVTSTNEGKKSSDEFVKRVAALASFGDDIRFHERQWTKKIHDHIVGPDAPPIMPGACGADRFPVSSASLKVDKLRLDNVSSREQSVIKTILWSSEQREILENNPDKVVFMSDFGTGKTLMLKTAAIMAARKSSTPVYYISLSGALLGGVCTSRTLFDMATEHCFQNSGVNFLSAQSLRLKYEERISEELKNTGGTINGFDVRKLVIWHVQDEPEAQYFIDELLCRTWDRPNEWITPLHQHPVVKANVVDGVAMTLSGDGSFTCDVCGMSLTHGQYHVIRRPYQCDTCMFTLCSWCRDSEQTFNVLEELKNNALKKLWVVLRNTNNTKSRYLRYKNYFIGKFVDCDLPLVARCCGNITKAANKYNMMYEDPPPTGRELDTCSGNPPRIISITKSRDDFINVLLHLIPKYAKSLVVLQFEDVDEEMMYECKKLAQQILPQHNFLQYSQLFDDEDNDDENAVLKFFNSSDDGVLFSDIYTVTGMEADVVILFSDELRQSHRDPMMRTISDMYFVMVDNSEDYESLVSEAGFKPYDI